MTQVFFEDFEDGTLNKWVNDGAWVSSTQNAKDGSRSAEIDGPVGNHCLTLKGALDLSEATVATLSFWWLIESGFDYDDWIALDCWDGDSWVEKAIVRGDYDPENTWLHKEIDLANFLFSTFKFRFRATVSLSLEDGYVDLIEVTGDFVTEKTSSDSASASDASQVVASLAKSESGVGTDSQSSMASAMVKAESGSGQDQSDLSGQFASQDQANGADAVGSYVAAFLRSESGSAIEVIIDRALVLIESGVVAEAVSMFRELVESGSGAETSYVKILAEIRQSSDSASGSESSALGGAQKGADSGSGQEGIGDRLLKVAEYPTGGIDRSSLLGAIMGSDLAEGLEASVVAELYTSSDVGAAVEAATLGASVMANDPVTGAEAAVLLATMLAEDSGLSLEAVVSSLRHTYDSGQGTEIVSLIGLVGRLMQTWVYTRAHHKAAVYSADFFETTIYTGTS